MPRDRHRNVHFRAASNPDVILGGLVQNGSVTEKNALDMLNTIFVRDRSFEVALETTGRIIEATDTPLERGVYLVWSEGPILLSNEAWVQRIISHSVSGRTDDFRDGVRARDGRCVVTGIVNPEAPDDWTSWEAAHVFPLAHESYWIHNNYGRWITDMDDVMGNTKINSVQNGLLLQSNVHKLFDQYFLSVNPDDGYKITSFRTDVHGFDGRILDPVCLRPDDPHRVSDHLLRWHFRQSVLANVRGAGEPVFEDDFPPGTDIMRAIEHGPMSKERFELELASRLREGVD